LASQQAMKASANVPDDLVKPSTSKSPAAVKQLRRRGLDRHDRPDEIRTRVRMHRERPVTWALFMSLGKRSDFFTLDSLAASESLLISFWNEVAVVQNHRRGKDRKPALPYLQQAVLFAEGVSASMIYLARRGVIDIPFKKWRGAGWPRCYVAYSE
jgi:hypothetical protein